MQRVLVLPLEHRRPWEDTDQLRSLYAYLTLASSLFVIFRISELLALDRGRVGASPLLHFPYYSGGTKCSGGGCPPPPPLHPPPSFFSPPSYSSPPPPPLPP